MKELLTVFIALAIITLFFRKHYLAVRKERVLSKFMAQEPAAGAESGINGILDALSIKPKGRSESSHDFSTVNRAFRRGEMHFARGNFEEAEKWFIKVLSLFEDHQEALNRLGVIYIQQKQLSKAELLFRKLLTLNQKESVYFSNFGRCLYAEGKLEEAAFMYQKALELDSSRTNRYVSLGQIYFELKKYEDALANFLTAYERDRKNLEYMEYLADLYDVMGSKEKLGEILDKMLELDPYNEILQERKNGLQITQTAAQHQ